MLAILSKEFKSFFRGATGYVFMGIFLLISGIFFANDNLIAANGAYSSVLGSITFIFLILVPITTMKLLAEEKNQKTDQLLLTTPLSIKDIVIGKYFASVALFFLTLAITMVYPLILKLYGTIAIGEIIATYIGFMLLGSAFISVGIFVSALTENQVVAAVSSFGALLIIWILQWIKQGIPSGKTSGIVFAVLLIFIFGVVIYFSTKNIIVTVSEILMGGVILIIIGLKNSNIFEGFAPRFFDWISLINRFDNFTMGILDLSSVVYYISFIIVFLYLTIAMVEKRRWS